MIEDTLCASFPVLSAVKFVPYSLSSHFAQPQQLNVQKLILIVMGSLHVVLPCSWTTRRDCVRQ